MKQLIVILLLILLPTVACTGPISAKAITGKIVDAETGKPIAGAILLVEWMKVHGFGSTYHTSEKVVEIFSDKDGIVKIPGYNDSSVENPSITVYKPGYVAWSNQWIFPSDINRTDFEWKNGYVFRLEKFKEGYSYIEHGSFVDLCINIGFPANKDKKNTFINIFEESEKRKRIHERNINEGGARVK
jgi:hypothetical protein